MLEGVLIALRRAWRRSAVHPASTVLHRRRLARAAAASSCSAAGVPGACASAWGCSSDFGANPPLALDVANVGLAALVDLDMLDRSDNRGLSNGDRHR
jgi:hypothetical protein